MKKATLILLLITSVFAGCKCAKSDTTSTATIYDNGWELEYLSGTRIAFEGLYPETKPTIQFDKTEMRISGNSSCNGYSGDFTLTENQIKVGEIMQTMRFCEGGGEQSFQTMLKKINKYSFDSEGKLLLLIDDIPMMRFKKIAKRQ
ncbi:MAG TPA: META domain-containing protein [Flavobacterium sp.]|nr:META domain-containing protein [Flavobacterium sp.]